MKICVTGLGLISAAGSNEAETLKSFEEQKRHSGPVSLFSSEISSPVYEVREFSRHYLPERLRTLNLCLAAVEDALEDAGLRQALKGKRVGIAMGTTIGSILNDLDFYREYRQKGNASMDAVDRYFMSNLADATHAFLQTDGPSVTVVNACASGADAIGAAMAWLRAGLCDIAIAGGSDEMNRVPLCGFSSLGILSPEPCRPFDKNRTGLNLGEGAGVLVLESRESARQRGKKPRAVMSGYGSSNDAHHLTSPDPSGKGLQRAVQNALAEAEIGAGDISFVNAHGTATKDNDLVEGLILNRLFGQQVLFLSTKGYTGHTLGAAGALEAGFTILGLEQGWVPASAGFSETDPEINMTPAAAKTLVRGRYALSTSLGFGGCDAALIIECPETQEQN